ncbi:uncharacterized protein [Ptychodera flava]|uniref:uncharacterized protein isoform X2 n=1 Tax=Ptychodera flava TaxID=63121 RepID=UPI003969EEC1
MEKVDINRNKRTQPKVTYRKYVRPTGTAARQRPTSSPAGTARTTKTPVVVKSSNHIGGKQPKKQEKRATASVDGHASTPTVSFRNRDAIKEAVILSHLDLPDTENRNLSQELEAMNLMVCAKKQRKRSTNNNNNNKKGNKKGSTTSTTKSDDSDKQTSKHEKVNEREATRDRLYVTVPGARHEQWAGILETLIVIAAVKQFASYLASIAKLSERKRVLSTSRRISINQSDYRTGNGKETRRVVMVPKGTYQRWCTILESVKTAIEETKQHSSTVKSKGYGTLETDECKDSAFKPLPSTIYQQWCNSVDDWDLAITSQQAENNMAALCICPGNEQTPRVDRRDVRKSVVLTKTDLKDDITIPMPLTICVAWEKLLKGCKINISSKASISKVQAKRFSSYEKPPRRLQNNDAPVDEHAQNKPPTPMEDTVANDASQVMMSVPEAAYSEWRKLLDAWNVMVSCLGYRQYRLTLPKLPDLEEDQSHSVDQSEADVEDKLKKIILMPKTLHDMWFKALDAWNSLISTLGYGSKTTYIQRLNLLKMPETAFTARRRRVCMSYIENSDDSDHFISIPELVLTDWLNHAHGQWPSILETGHEMLMALGYEDYKTSLKQVQEFKDHVYGKQGGGGSSKAVTDVEKVYQHWVKLRDTWNAMVTVVGQSKLAATIPNIQGLEKNFKSAIRDTYLSDAEFDSYTEHSEGSGPVITLIPMNLYQVWDRELRRWILKAMKLGDEKPKSSIRSPGEVKNEILGRFRGDDNRIHAMDADSAIDNTLLIPRTNHQAWSKVLDKWNTMMTALDYENYSSTAVKIVDCSSFSNAKPYDHTSVKFLKKGLNTPVPETKTYQDKWKWFLDAMSLMVSAKQRQRCVKLLPEIQVNHSVIARTPLAFGSRGTKPGMFNHPCGIIINKHGKMVISDKDNHRLQVLDRRGLCKVTSEFKKFLRPFMPFGIAYSDDGKFFVTDISNNQIVVCNEYDQVLRIFGPKEGIVPRGITVTPQGQVLVTDVQEGRSCIRKYTLDGRHLGEFATYSAAEGQTQYPCALTVNSKGHVIVPGNGRPVIQTYDCNGRLQSSFSTASSVVTPYGIDVDQEDNVYICDFWNDRIAKYTGEGKFLYTIGQGQLKGPIDVAVISPFVIAVTEHQKHRVSILNL